MKQYIQSFWNWYERHYVLNVGIALFLFVLQIFHLLWLWGDVVMVKVGFEAIFHVHDGPLHYALLLVDYTEIPAIISISLIYINQLRKGFSAKSFWLLVFLNTQWLHLFWITDEFVVETFTGDVRETLLPVWLAWVAILIDYLELPVIYDTCREFFRAWREKRMGQFLKEDFREMD